MTTNLNLNPDVTKNEELKKVIAALFHRTSQLLKSEFPGLNVSGHVRYHNILGPFFAYELKDNETNLAYNCGFSFNELLEKHKDEDRARQWLASFYIDMIDEKVNRPLPAEPANPDEANVLVRDVIIPHCLKSIREEFGEAKVEVKFGQHPKVGTVIESSMPTITSEPNSIVLPLQLLLALHLLNRDFTDPLLNGLYRISETVN